MPAVEKRGALRAAFIPLATSKVGPRQCREALANPLGDSMKKLAVVFGPINANLQTGEATGEGTDTLVGFEDLRSNNAFGNT